MDVIAMMCLAMAAIGIILALLPGSKYENLLQQYFIFCVVVCTIIFFGNLIANFS